MTGAELRCLMDSMGITPAWLARRFVVDRRTVTRWTTGEVPVPPTRTSDIHKLVDEFVAMAKALPIEDGPTIRVPIRDGDGEWPAASIRIAAVSRISDSLARIKYETEGE